MVRIRYVGQKTVEKKSIDEKILTLKNKKVSYNIIYNKNKERINFNFKKMEELLEELQKKLNVTELSSNDLKITKKELLKVYSNYLTLTEKEKRIFELKTEIQKRKKHHTILEIQQKEIPLKIEDIQKEIMILEIQKNRQ
ncbi:hypothetical protein [Methanococcus maripaludis]|uniref:Uncharacterized protein n=1 Tax=Methanococcus maripaludis TaxID=39152 RepID=A0A2L1C8E3_METMI|nr:hypothetical protein [Methanococcus maripaludis]AVB75648.1 hypothetical protein MMJJ_02290 [Methanococcus maripaludis]